MKSTDIAIVDYQMSNLRSVQKALEHVGAKAEITSDPEIIGRASKVILPGVGAFGDAIQELKARGLIEPILEAAGAGKPFLGICLGLQILFEVGFEGGEQPGLGMLRGTVERFLPMEGLKIPHMGWNQIIESKPDCPLLRGIEPGSYFYFVHSFYVKQAEPSLQWLSTEYGVQFCSAIWRDNIFATQFHPEKSQGAGLRLLENFAQL